MKLSNIKNAFTKIFSDRNVQLTIALFGIGFILALTATFPILEERIENDKLYPENEDKLIEARIPRPYDKPHDGMTEILESPHGLKNATLEIRSETENTNASIRILDSGEREMKSWEIENGENKKINMTEHYEAEFIEFEIREGELSYTFTVNHYILPYSSLSIPAYILMWISVIFLLRAIALMGPLSVDEKEKDKIRKNQKVIDGILKDKKEDVNRKNEEND